MRVFLNVISTMFLLFYFARPVQAAQPLPGDTAKLPDLSVRLTLKKEASSEGKYCFNLQPIYTVSNKGDLPAKNFKVKLEWKSSNTSSWHFVTSKGIKSLAGGAQSVLGTQPG